MRAPIAAIACLVAGALLLGSTLFLHRWGATHELVLEEIGEVGLRDTAGCEPGPACPAGAHGATLPTQIEGEQFARLGQLAFWLGVAAALGALAIVHPRARRVLGVPVAALAIGAVAAATAFLVTEPFGQFEMTWAPGLAWWLCVAGAALIVVGARLGPGSREAAVPRAPAVWVALAIAAPALALTAHSTSWWQGTRRDLTLAVGPAMVESCMEVACFEERLGDLAGGGRASSGRGLSAPQADLMGDVLDGAFQRERNDRIGKTAVVAGRAVAVLAAVAALLAAALALLVAARRRARVVAVAAILAGAALLVAILLFEGRMTDPILRRMGTLHRASGLAIALVGTLGAIGAAALALRSSMPAAQVAPIAQAAPAAPPARIIDTAATATEPPPCPTCRTPMLWVSRRGIWLCTLCKDRTEAAS